MLLLSADLLLSKWTFKNTIRGSNGLDSDQNRCSFCPDLGLNCFQKLSADTEVAAFEERDNIWLPK